MNNYFSSLSAIEIVNLCQKELNLSFKTQGKDYFCICPFHVEKTPSLAFDSQKKIFKCFGCEFGAKNFFNFWVKVKKIDPVKAQQEIKKLGYSFENEEVPEIKKTSKKTQLFNLVKEIYQHNLFSKEGHLAYDYLIKERKLDNSIIKKFALGCSINQKQIKNLFMFQDFKLSRNDWLKELILLGLLRDNNQNQVNDLFRENQLIIPLENEKSETVAFAARKLKNSTWIENKYIFLPNYEGYQKSSFLYNYWRVKKEDKNHYYLVEGFFDVISLSKKGIDNCLALLGTTLSQFQLKLLKKLNKKIILFFDGDQAGRQAVIKITLTFLNQNIECEVINHSLKIDPDEICREKSDELFEIIKKKEDPYLFILNHFREIWEVRENPQSINSFIRQIANLFQESEKKTQLFLIEKICSLIGWNEEEVEKIYHNKKTFELREEVENKSVKGTTNLKEEIILKKESEIINHCFKERNFWRIIYQQKYQFTQQKMRYLYQILENFYTSYWSQQFPSEYKINIMRRGIELPNNNTMDKELSEEIFKQMLEKIVLPKDE